MSNEERDRRFARLDRDRATQESAKMAVKILTDGVNTFSDDTFVKAFIEELTCRTHRTLQQNTARLLLDLFRAWAGIYDKGDGYYDLRNEATVKLAKVITEKVKNENCFLPFI